eukprot:1642047-Rhodomonas_salina.1
MAALLAAGASTELADKGAWVRGCVCVRVSAQPAHTQATIRTQESLHVHRAICPTARSASVRVRLSGLGVDVE